MAIWFNDTFTDTNGVGLTSHTSDSGHTWARPTVGAGAAGPVAAIQSNKLVADQNQATLASVTITPASADYEVESVFTYASIDATHGVGARCYINAGAIYGYFLILDVVSGSQMSLRIYKLHPSTGTTYLTSHYNISTPSGGANRTIKLRVEGTTNPVLTAFYEGSQVTFAEGSTITDTSNQITGAGAPGVYRSSQYYGASTGWSQDSMLAQDVSGGGDTLAPNVPSPSVGTRTASQITWNWSAVSDNGGGATAGYQVQLLDNADTVLATTDLGSVLNYTCPSTTGNTVRKLRVAAYDNAVPRNLSAYSTAVSSTTLSKTASFVVKDVNGAAQASESSLRWAACSGTVGSALTVVAQGTAETTDGSGNCVIDLNSTSLSAGNSITVIMADDSPSARLGVLEGITVSET